MLFMKIGAKVLDFWLRILGPIGPKLVFRYILIFT